MSATVSDGANPFILLARITVSPGKLDAYLDLAAGVDAEVEASEPGMLFHNFDQDSTCLLYTSPSPRDMRRSRMPSSA